MHLKTASSEASADIAEQDVQTQQVATAITEMAATAHGLPAISWTDNQIAQAKAHCQHRPAAGRYPAQGDGAGHPGRACLHGRRGTGGGVGPHRCADERDPGHCGSDQSAGAQRRHRGGAGRGAGARLCGGGGRGANLHCTHKATEQIQRQHRPDPAYPERLEGNDTAEPTDPTCVTLTRQGSGELCIRCWRK